MPTNRNLRDFFELRRGLEGMRELVNDFVEATTQFLDEQGIAMMARKKRKAGTNGHAPVNMDALRETVARAYGNTRKRAVVDEADVKEPDGRHMSMAEAAQFLDMSEANVRLLTKNGKLPEPSYERRFSKKHPERAFTSQVLLKEDVLAYARTRKGGNGDSATAGRGNAISAAWTPERRAAQAERMRKRAKASKKPKKSKKPKAAKKAHSSASGKGWAQKWYARLEEHGPESVGTSAKALNTSSSSLLSSSTKFFESGVIKKGKEKGIYQIGATAPPEPAAAP